MHGHVIHVFQYFIGTALAVMTICRLLGLTAREQLALALTWDCVITQIIWSAAGGGAFAARPLFIVDGAFCIAVSMIGLTHRSKTALWVVALFGVTLVFQFLCFLVARQGDLFYYSGRNAIYGLQLLTVGGSALVTGFARLHRPRWLRGDGLRGAVAVLRRG